MSNTWFVPRQDLSQDQSRAVELDPREHRLILGAPGSGKTIVLLHRARHLIESQSIAPKRLRIFVFTNTLKDYIRSAVSLLDLPEESVTTFDHWCREFYTTFVGRRVPFAKHGPDFEAIRAGVLDKLRGGAPLSVLQAGTGARGAPVQRDLLEDDSGRERRPPQEEFPEFFAKVIGCPLYDAVLVDEGQDLTQDAFEILRRIAAHVTVCMDAKQQLYEKRCDEPDILRSLGLRRSNLTFLSAYRCCPYITKLAASLLRDLSDKTAFLNQTRTVQTERLTPLLFIAPNADAEKARVAEIIRARQLAGDRIAVLMPNNAKLFALAKVLQDAGLEIEVPQRGRDTEFKTHDFTSDCPKLMTYYGAKGLTFETVIMPRLVPSSFLQVQPKRLEKLLFVGITRATKWAYMSTVEGPMLPLVLQIAGMEKDGTVTLQRTADNLPLLAGEMASPAAASVKKVATADSLTDLF
jgi:superfamily I DNA/RNA helicase